MKYSSISLPVSYSMIYKVAREGQHSVKRRRMMSDLEGREKASFSSFNSEREAKLKEETIMRKLEEELKRIRKMLAKKNSKVEDKQLNIENVSGNVKLDQSRVLKLSWEKGINEGYTAARLRELFEEFGEVEDVVIRGKRRSALVVMTSKESVVAASGVLIGDLCNPLLVLPLEPVNLMPFVREQEPVTSNMSNVVGGGFQAFENSVLDKIRKAAQKQK